MWKCPNRRSRPLPKNPETLSPILMSIYKVYVSTSVIFRALWNHLGHPLPTHRGESNHARHLQNSRSCLEGPITAVCTTSYFEMVYCLGGFESTESWKR